MCWVGVMRWASGRGGRVHTSYEFPPKGACNIMQNHANYPARRGDLLRRAADLIENASARPPHPQVVSPAGDRHEGVCLDFMLEFCQRPCWHFEAFGHGFCGRLSIDL